VPIATYIAWGGDLGMASLPDRDGLRQTYDRGTFWWEELPGGVVYVRYAQVQAAPAADLAAMAERARDPSVRRVVLDLRQNPGGDNHNNAALLRVFTDPAVDVAGRITVLTDRLTFSAAANLATHLERETQAAFVGEPMGGGLNFWGDARFVDLPHWPIPMRAGISSRYWQLSTPDDPRLSIEPDVPVALSAGDWAAGRDAVLEAAVAD
jgi:C-terminal processing protease CtpA/Prc